jgi:hypothetical protein
VCGSTPRDKKRVRGPRPKVKGILKVQFEELVVARPLFSAGAFRKRAVGKIPLPLSIYYYLIEIGGAFAPPY